MWLDFVQSYSAMFASLHSASRVAILLTLTLSVSIKAVVSARRKQVGIRHIYSRHCWLNRLCFFSFCFSLRFCFHLERQMWATRFHVFSQLILFLFFCASPLRCVYGNRATSSSICSPPYYWMCISTRSMTHSEDVVQARHLASISLPIHLVMIGCPVSHSYILWTDGLYGASTVQEAIVRYRWPRTGKLACGRVA